MQKVKSSIKHHTINPEWNEELTLSITNMMLPVKIVSYSSPSASTQRSAIAFFLLLEFNN
jgi:Ca2+-dependent lipid-binding protein